MFTRVLMCLEVLKEGRVLEYESVLALSVKGSSCVKGSLSVKASFLAFVSKDPCLECHRVYECSWRPKEGLEDPL